MPRPPFQIVGPPWWREMCAGYLAWLHRKGRRPNTLLAYGYELLAFGQWLERVAIADVDQLTGQHLERFQDARAGKVKPKTQQVSASAVRGVLKWAATQEPPLCRPALWLHIVMPRVGRLLPRPIPRADLDKLLAAFQHRPEPSDLVGLRTRALFLVILSSGARIAEALSLDRDQLQDRQAFVVQKGGGEKLLVISETAEQAVADYVAARIDACPALFVSHVPGQPIARLSRKGRKGRGQGSWNELCKELGIRRFTSHRIRHSTATEMIRAGGNPIMVAKHMGHRGLASIDGYAEVGLEERQLAMVALDARMSPMGNKPATSEAPDQEPWSIDEMFTELRWNHDANSSVSQEALAAFAQLTRRPDLIEQAAMSTQEFVEWAEARGGWWPLEGTDWSSRQSAWAGHQLAVLGPE